MKYDYLVVGSGLFGAVFARQMTDAGRKVLVIDGRSHVGGNCHTARTPDGIHVHKYGPHIFHTSNEQVWAFVTRFAAFNHFVNRVKANYNGRIFSMPVNLMTLHQFYGVTTPAEAESKLREVRVPNPRPRNLEEWCLDKVGPDIYEALVRGYTEKQWMRPATDLPHSIISRLPIRLNYNDNYYDDKYQGVPVGGYTGMFDRILRGIDVRLGFNFEDVRSTWRETARELVYTGAIDEFFGHKHGALEYRTLEFVEEVHDGDYQGVAQMNYTDRDTPWTRVVEHKHFEFGTQAKTVITKEIPAPWAAGKSPYYPIRDEKNLKVYRRYAEEVVPGVTFGGRLGTFNYFDMDVAISQALVFASRAISRTSGGCTAG